MRVVERRHHLLRPRRRARPGRPRARRRRGRLGACAATRAEPRRADGAQRADAAVPIAAPPRGGRPPRARRSCCASSTSAARARGRRDRPGHRLLRGGPPRGHGRQLRRAASPATTAPACGSAPRSSPAASDTVETGAETLGAHRGFELLEDDPGLIAEQAARKALTLLDAGPAPAGLDAGGGRRRLRRRPLPRDDRPRPRGRPHPEGRQRLRRQARRAGRAAAAERLRRRPPAGRVGHATRSTTRARRRQKTQVIEDGRLTSYLYDHLQRRARRRRLDRQRPPRELPPPADPAHDQHLHRARRRRPRRR